MNPIQGSIVALVTPMLEDGRIDFDALRRLIDWHIAEGTDCIGVVGTTGESPTVSMEENCEVIRVAVAACRRACAHHGRHGCQLHRRGHRTDAFCQAGGRRLPPLGGALLQPAFAGRHLPALQGHREAVDLPLVLYNVPGRTVADMLPETTLRLAQLPRIVGIKEATGNIERACQLIKHRPPGFAVYSGDDGTAVALMLLGGDGNVSVTANIAPRLMHELCMAALEGNTRQATALHMQLLPLHKQLFCEPSPAPAKWALAQLGRCAPHVRLPIVPLTAAGQAAVGQALRDAGLLA